jgi:hypothetical protein
MIDPDVWPLATPRELLTLCERLGMSGSDVARWLHVPRSSVSTWRHEARRIPCKHIATLRVRTQVAYAHAVELQAKACSLAPNEATAHAIQAEFAAMETRWMLEVLSAAAAPRRKLHAVADTLQVLVEQEPLMPEDYARLAACIRTLQDVLAAAPSEEHACLEP